MADEKIIPIQERPIPKSVLDCVDGDNLLIEYLREFVPTTLAMDSFNKDQIEALFLGAYIFCLQEKLENNVYTCEILKHIIEVCKKNNSANDGVLRQFEKAEYALSNRAFDNLKKTDILISMASGNNKWENLSSAEKEDYSEEAKKFIASDFSKKVYKKEDHIEFKVVSLLIIGKNFVDEKFLRDSIETFPMSKSITIRANKLLEEKFPEAMVGRLTSHDKYEVPKEFWENTSYDKEKELKKEKIMEKFYFDFIPATLTMSSFSKEQEAAISCDLLYRFRKLLKLEIVLGEMPDISPYTVEILEHIKEVVKDDWHKPHIIESINSVLDNVDYYHLHYLCVHDPLINVGTSYSDELGYPYKDDKKNSIEKRKILDEAMKKGIENFEKGIKIDKFDDMRMQCILRLCDTKYFSEKFLQYAIDNFPDNELIAQRANKLMGEAHQPINNAVKERIKPRYMPKAGFERPARRADDSNKLL